MVASFYNFSMGRYDNYGISGMRRDVQHLGFFLFYFFRWNLYVVHKEISENCRNIFFNEYWILIDEVFNIIFLNRCMDVANKCLFDVFSFTVNPCLFRVYFGASTWLARLYL